MNYVIWKPGPDELVAFGAAEKCAEIICGGDTMEFNRMVSACSRGRDVGYEIHTVPNGGIFACPCDSCAKGPGPNGMVSASCDTGACDKWMRWFRRYWHRLRQKCGME